FLLIVHPKRAEPPGNVLLARFSNVSLLYFEFVFKLLPKLRRPLCLPISQSRQQEQRSSVLQTFDGLLHALCSKNTSIVILQDGLRIRTQGRDDHHGEDAHQRKSQN